MTVWKYFLTVCCCSAMAGWMGILGAREPVKVLVFHEEKEVAAERLSVRADHLATEYNRLRPWGTKGTKEEEELLIGRQAGRPATVRGDLTTMAPGKPSSPQSTNHASVVMISTADKRQYAGIRFVG